MFSSGSTNLISALRSNSWQILQSELYGMLDELEVKLQSQHWWGDKWVFVKDKGGDRYISKKAWLTGDGKYKVCIGIESFTPENLFSDIPEQSNLYIWASKRIYITDLQEVAKKLVQGGKHNYGPINSNINGQYLIQCPIIKCSPGAIPQLYGTMQNDIFKFIDYFGSVL